MTARARFDRYRWTGGQEAMLRFGPDAGPVAVMALPLLEEANRTRAFAVSILRALADRGVAGALPDVPGQGDSLLLLEGVSLRDMQQGFAAAVTAIAHAGGPCYAVAIRSGALIDADSRVGGRWYLSPQGGADLLREWRKIAASTSDRRSGPQWFPDATDPPNDDECPPVDIAGNRVSTAFLADLTVSEPWRPNLGGPLRILRLEADARAADRHVAGAPLWRRAEPGEDRALAAVLADDIASWIARCEG